MGDITTIIRESDEGCYDREMMYTILDEALICHVAFSHGDQPFNVPMTFARLDDDLFIHASTKSRIFNELSKGINACVSITLLDGIVFAKSAYSHSMNFRSVMMFGSMTPVTEKEEKLRIGEALVEKMRRGRWKDCRKPSDKELSVTGFLKLKIDKFSSKIRTGPPEDIEEDKELPFWSGVVPYTLRMGEPVEETYGFKSIQTPDYIKKK